MEINELLRKKSYEELKEIAKDIEIKDDQYQNRNQLLVLISKCFKEYEEYKTNNKYVKIKQLGNKGKEGITYLVKDKINDIEYAMKTFNKRKSPANIKKEADLQKKVSETGICPKVIDVDLVSNCIIMEKMDEHLFDVMKKQCGNLTEEQQKQILNIFIKLDDALVFHGDSNILNYMLKNNRIYIRLKIVVGLWISGMSAPCPNCPRLNRGQARSNRAQMASSRAYPRYPQPVGISFHMFTSGLPISGYRGRLLPAKLSALPSRGLCRACQQPKQIPAQT